jgi:deazaflavin-dependent oxidoreductase (nitroreductase family)
MAGPPAAAKTFNRFAVHLAGRRWFPLWAVLRHRGRRSGTEYSVPVAVLATDDAFLIALPWGRGTDWVRNTVAAQGCTVRWKGRLFACTGPEFVGRDAALAATSGITRRMIERWDVEAGYLRLRRSPTSGS